MQYEHLQHVIPRAIDDMERNGCTYFAHMVHSHLRLVVFTATKHGAFMSRATAQNDAGLVWMEWRWEVT